MFVNLKTVSLDSDYGTLNRRNTDVVDKVNCLVAASQHMGTSMAEGSPREVHRNDFVLTDLHGESFPADYLEKEIVGFDENVTVVFWCDLQHYVMLQ